jgi:O-antigen/teichoic acid export membrane protein
MLTSGSGIEVIATVRRAWSMISHRALRGEFIWVAVGQVGLLAGGLLTIKVLTNLLGPTAFGEFALSLSVVGALVSLLYGPMGQAVTRFWPLAESEHVEGAYFGWIRRNLRLSIGLCFLLLAAGLGAVLAMLDRGWLLLAVSTTVLAIAAGGNAVFAALLNGMRMRKPMALIQTGDPLFRVASASIAVLLIGQSGWAAAMGSALGASLVLGVSMLYLRRHVRLRAPERARGARELGPQMTAYMIPFVLLSLFGLVGLYGDRWVIQARLGLADVGVYAAMFQVANGPVVALLALLNQFSYPLVFGTARERVGGEAFSAGRLAYSRFLALSAVTIGAVALAAYLFGELLLELLTSRDYTVYHRGLWLIVLGVSFVNFGQQLMLKGLLFAKPEVYILPRAVHSAGFLMLALLLGRSVVGVCAAGAVAAAIYLISMQLANRYLRTATTSQESRI